MLQVHSHRRQKSPTKAEIYLNIIRDPTNRTLSSISKGTLGIPLEIGDPSPHSI
ncbi:hypothetical protein HOU41_gp105 [Proteus phage Stubb]|uniref:Uncharacterized protein n=1 Tax=Proteus phage Stubb TaxID=2315597 RepID=A0A3B8E0G2_9CAUD|nr:hypothetical protein HOU41_gp105 [Proteus phage Stubb]AYJ73239.1 hypothetical protein CPT_Stubb_123 [Proteus phage Stubb]UXY92384.1 hypothetical protein [Proteus phage RP7]